MNPVIALQLGLEPYLNINWCFRSPSRIADQASLGTTAASWFQARRERTFEALLITVGKSIALPEVPRLHLVPPPKDTQPVSQRPLQQSGRSDPLPSGQISGGPAASSFIRVCIAKTTLSPRAVACASMQAVRIVTF